MSDRFSIQDLDRLLGRESSALTAETASVYTRYAVVPFLGERLLAGTREPTFIVALAGDEVLYYDDIEEEFGTGTLDSTGLIVDEGTWGERLEWALLHFPSSGTRD